MQHSIPLAIELAAARCRQMSVEAISTDVDDRFHLLTGGARTVLPRQQTLAASVDWSYDRLDATEQQVFRRLGVFAGPFSLEAAEVVAGGPSEMDRVVVFDAISRLVDKSLVQLEDHPDGHQHYRLLETLRAYAIERAREAGELDTAKDAHVNHWLDWLERREPTLHTDVVIQRIERVHDTVVAALEWSTHDPVRGLPLLRYLARVWQGSGRPQSVLNAVDLLLTEPNGRLYPVPWAAAATSAAVPVRTARGGSDWSNLLMRARALALEADDDYFVAVSDMLLGFTNENCDRVKLLARERGQRYVECIASIAQAASAVEIDPTLASSMLTDSDIVAAARESRYLRDFANRTAARAAVYLGNVADGADRAHELASSPSLLMAESAARLLATVGLLTRDQSLADAAMELAQTRLAHVPGTRPSADTVAHQRALLSGAATHVEPEIEPENTDPHDPLPGYILSLLCREAIDAGRSDVAVAAVQAHPLDSPLHRTIQTAIEAAAANDETLWHDTITLAGEHGLRLIATDALEGLACTAGDAEAWSECVHLAASAQRLRNETGYHWRFPFEEQRLNAALKAATEALGDAATATATTEGAAIDWRDTIAYANRARGQRTRPSHGWAALTPTELQVVALAAEGLTNPQIAERLFMGRATVKTHLEHAFTKTGFHTRTELAAEYARRNVTD